MADIQKVTDRVNAARAACCVPPIRELPRGERGNPCFCPLGRALRKDMGDSFFVAIGTRHLRLASIAEDATEIARRIREAWGIANDDRVIIPGNEQFHTLPLPSELSQFVVEFDAGKLPEFETKVEEAEKLRFADLARRLWNVTVDRLRRVRRLGRRGKSEAAIELS